MEKDILCFTFSNLTFLAVWECIFIVPFDPPSPQEMFLSIYVHICFDNSERSAPPKFLYQQVKLLSCNRVHCCEELKHFISYWNTLIENSCVFVWEGKWMLCYFIHLQNLGRQVRSVGTVEAHSLRENVVLLFLVIKGAQKYLDCLLPLGCISHLVVYGRMTHSPPKMPLF